MWQMFTATALALASEIKFSPKALRYSAPAKYGSVHGRRQRDSCRERSSMQWVDGEERKFQDGLPTSHPMAANFWQQTFR